jgi:hypothetical protein
MVPGPLAGADHGVHRTEAESKPVHLGDARYSVACRNYWDLWGRGDSRPPICQVSWDAVDRSRSTRAGRPAGAGDRSARTNQRWRFRSEGTGCPGAIRSNCTRIKPAPQVGCSRRSESNRPILYQCRDAIKPGVGISRSDVVSRDIGRFPPSAGFRLRGQPRAIERSRSRLGPARRAQPERVPGALTPGAKPQERAGSGIRRRLPAPRAGKIGRSRRRGRGIRRIPARRRYRARPVRALGLGSRLNRRGMAPANTARLDTPVLCFCGRSSLALPTPLPHDSYCSVMCSSCIQNKDQFTDRSARALL